VDYVLSRPDLDQERLAPFGVSLGARLGAIALAIEKRFKTAVLWSGGFRSTPALPDNDEINYAPRGTTPASTNTWGRSSRCARSSMLLREQLPQGRHRPERKILLPTQQQGEYEVNHG
jgi:hypothetical protein